MKWPWGRRARVEGNSVDLLPDDHPVNYWVCFRVDEPWTWQLMSEQHLGRCTRCSGAIIFRVSEKSPTDPAVQKICKRCAELFIAGKPQG